MPTKDHPRQTMSPGRRAEFLRVFRECGGIWATACRRVAHPARSKAKMATKHPPALSSFRALAARDPEFGAAIEEILQDCRDDVEREIMRRGQEGYTDNVYQKGEQVFNRDGTPAVVHKFSDNLLLARARALMPDKYSEKKSVHHSGHISHGTAGHLTIATADLRALNASERKQLTSILGTIQEARGDTKALEYQPGEVLDADFELIEWDDHGNSRQVKPRKREIKE